MRRSRTADETAVLKRRTRMLRWMFAFMGVGLASWLDAPAASAQPEDVIRACYIPSSGVVYRIGESDLPDTCRSPRHVEFSWNVEGPAGPPSEGSGLSGYEVVPTIIPFTLPPNTVLSTFAQCPAGKVALGGGGGPAGPPYLDVVLVDSKPRSVRFPGRFDEWVVAIRNISDFSQDVQIRAFVVCADPPT
jgi:hypothetical protein